MMSNIPWTKDELIVTLALYCSRFPSIPNQDSEETRELSVIFREFHQKSGKIIGDRCRSPGSVYMKFMNFHHLNPDYRGNGLHQVGKDGPTAQVFQDFRHDPNLSQMAKTIKVLMISNSSYETPNSEWDVDVPEGKLLINLHFERERNQKIVSRKKGKVLTETGALKCEVCDFDFKETYRDRGDGFIECHHKKPLSKMKENDRTTLNDLSLVCSNCHRMIHRHRPWLTVDELKNALSK